MQIDWKSLIYSSTHRILLLVLGFIAAKWAFAAETVNKLMAGDTVELWSGGWTITLAEIERWLTVVAIPALASIWLSWRQRIKGKQGVNAALQLPRGATKADVQVVVDESPKLTTAPSPQALRQVIHETNLPKRNP